MPFGAPASDAWSIPRGSTFRGPASQVAGGHSPLGREPYRGRLRAPSTASRPPASSTAASRSRDRIRSCRPSFRQRLTPRFGREAGPELLHRSMQARLDGSKRESERVGRLLEWQAEVEMQGDERSLIRRETSEAALQLVAIRQRRGRILAIDVEAGDMLFDS